MQHNYASCKIITGFIKNINSQCTAGAELGMGLRFVTHVEGHLLALLVADVSASPVSVWNPEGARPVASPGSQETVNSSMTLGSSGD